jgi:flagellar motor switch protein FliM
MFGSDGRYHVRVEGRDFTPTEQRIIQRLLEVVMEEYRKAWEPVFKTEFTYVRSEMNTQFANIATPTEVVVAFTFKIELGSGGGDFHVCFPYSMIEPLRDVLYSSMQADRMESDNRWLKLLSREVQNSEVELVATLGSAQITLGDILDLKVGDVIAIDIPESIVATVDGVPLIEGAYGILNNQYAIKVEKLLTAPEHLMLEDDQIGGIQHEQ